MHNWCTPFVQSLLFVVFVCHVVSATSSKSGPSSCCFAFVSKGSRRNKHDRETMRKQESVRYRGRVAYDGTGFAGFQFQPGDKRTVQGELEGVLSLRFNRTIMVLGAGRTDAGVHAKGQAFHFDLLPRDIDSMNGNLKQLQNSMNKMLADDVVVFNISQAPRFVETQPPNGTTQTYRWSVMYNSLQKLYSYRLSTGSVMNPLDRHQRWHVDWTLDMHQLSRILKSFEGTHDFRAFAGAIEQNEKKSGKPMSTIRTVYKAELIEEGHGNYRIDFLLEGALYKMVRNMVGTAIDVCRERGRVNEERFLELLYHSDKTNKNTRDDNPCKPAPPQGLTLEHVYFDDF